ncbi:MAG: UDP-N-acetylglucosamine--N-acetylmuramyl-(pentapeptide) pyrophosphoryl-undecaprenol N-acetylglucosamine transferase, partial [Ferruginibacter sp.]
SNQLLGKKATRIFVATDGVEKFFPVKKIQLTGNPVRASIVQSTILREEGIRFFGLDPAKQTILSIGGSLGAKMINEAIASSLNSFEANNLQLIWQSGKTYASRAKEIIQGSSNIWAGDFITDMEYAYAAADLVISRSGAMAIAELCVVKKPVIMVPYPFAAEDHQTVNAQNLVNKNAALMITDKEALNGLVPAIIELAKDEAKKTMLKNNISKLGITNADDIIAQEILKLIN